jgi:phage gp36-like protein
MNPIWQPSHAYEFPTVVIDTNGNVQMCSVAGTSAFDPPQWATAVGGTTAESPDTLEWTCVVSYSGLKSYATVGDLLATVTFRDLVQLSNEDPTAQTIDQGRLQTQLTMASRVIDSYLEARYQLPLPYVPEALVSTCIDIALYRLQVLRPLHDLRDARKRYEDAQTFLMEINRGRLALALDVAGRTIPGASPTQTTLTGGQSDIMIRTDAAAAEGTAQMFDRRSMRVM